MLRTVEVPGDKVEVTADIGPVRIVSATLLVDDGAPIALATDPNDMPYDQWKKNFDEICALAPINPCPVDDSREAIYGPDPGETDSRE
jgi:hypothetical protein